jgi:hypothetical protein
MAEMRKQCKPLLQERDELICHLLKLVDVAVPIHVAETCADRVVHEENIGELIPRAINKLKIPSLSDSVGANLHQGTVFRTATWPSIQPYYRPRSVGEVFILKVPEEEVSVVFRRYFYMTFRRLATCSYDMGHASIPSMHLQ